MFFYLQKEIAFYQQELNHMRSGRACVPILRLLIENAQQSIDKTNAFIESASDGFTRGILADHENGLSWAAISAKNGIGEDCARKIYTRAKKSICRALRLEARKKLEKGNKKQFARGRRNELFSVRGIE